MNEIEAAILTTMDNDDFIMFGWQSLTSHRFGEQAEARLEENRDRLYEIGVDEMLKATWTGLQGEGDEEALKLSNC
jgi:NAD(P)H-flavin reductase